MLDTRVARVRPYLRGIGCLAVMLLFSRAELFGGHSPFAIAYFAAGLFSGRNAAFMVAGCMLGIFRLNVMQVNIMLPAGLCMTLIGCLTLERLNKRLGEAGLCALLAGISAFAPGALFTGLGLSALLLSILSATLAAVLAPLFLCAMSINSRKLSREQLAAIMCACVGLLMGLAGFNAGLTDGIAQLAAAAITLAFSYEGAGMGAIAGTLAGLTLMTGGMGLVFPAYLAATGILAGVVMPRSKYFAALVSPAMCLLAAIYSPVSPPMYIPAVLAGAVPVIMSAERVSRFLPEMKCGGEALISGVNAENARRLKALSKAFSELSSDLPAAELPDEQALLTDMRSMLCSDCERFADCWAGDDNRAARLMCQLMTRASQGEIYDTHAPPDIMRLCVRGAFIPETLSPMLREFFEKRRTAILRAGADELIRAQLTEAGRLVSGMAETRLTPVTQRRLTLAARTGVAAAGAVEGMESGDMHMVSILTGGRLLLAISDGMGTGHAAARESGMALKLMHSLLSAEISLKRAADSVNSLMLLRGVEDMFATLDMCVLDLATGEAEFLKLAACRTLILREGDVTRIEGKRLPLGILPGVTPANKKYKLKPGDVLLMGTDGAMDALSDEELIEMMKKRADSPRELAEAALGRACELVDRRDDMTILCMEVRHKR